jgi:cyclic pyranopterin phosphate synthase
MTGDAASNSPTEREAAHDLLGRPLHDLRVSVTDRCNFRCRYCMPRERFATSEAFLRRSELLSFEEISSIVSALRPLGLRKVRLTGGEPLLRSKLSRLVAMLTEGSDLDVALTTNGSLLREHALALKAAGLNRVTVSLDSLNENTFRLMTDADTSVARVLDGIEAADAAGLAPLKINVVVQRGVNDHEVPDIAARFKGTGHIVRFIEYMDVGSTNGWSREHVVTGREMLSQLQQRFSLVPVSRQYRGEVAERYRYQDGSGEIGLICSVSAPFCGDCSRARLSANGTLYTCLFATTGTDLKSVLRCDGVERVVQLVADVWRRRSDRYSEVRPLVPLRRRKIEMSYIGG